MALHRWRDRRGRKRFTFARHAPVNNCPTLQGSLASQAWTAFPLAINRAIAAAQSHADTRPTAMVEAPLAGDPASVLELLEAGQATVDPDAMVEAPLAGDPAKELELLEAGQATVGPDPEQALERVVSRPLQLRGTPVPSAKSIREQENAEALGGMRQPWRSVQYLPDVAAVKRALLPILQSHLYSTMMSQPSSRGSIVGQHVGADAEAPLAFLAQLAALSGPLWPPRCRVES